MGRSPPKITKFLTEDPLLNRLQEHYSQVLNPVLDNPALRMSDWRFNQGPFPTQTSPACLLLQHRVPTDTDPDNWKTVGAFDSTGAFSGSGGGLSSILTTKGDLVAGLGAGAVSRLGVGTDGNVLTADAAQTTGVKWAVGSGSSLTPFQTTWRNYKSWSLQDSASNVVANAFSAVPTFFGAGSRTTVNGTDRFWMSFNLPSSLNGSSGLWWGGTNGWTRRLHLPKLVGRIRLNSKTNIHQALGLCGTAGGTQGSQTTGYTPTLGGINTDTAHFAEIAHDSRVGGNFIFGCGDGTSANWIDTGVTPTTTDDYLLIIDCSAGTGSVVATIVNCTSLVSTTVSLSAHLPAPSVDVLGPELYGINLAAPANSGPFFEYAYMEHN